MKPHEITVEKPKRWFKTKVTLLCTVIGTAAAVLVARNDAANTLDWFTSMVHMPAKVEKLQANIDALRTDMNAGFIETRERGSTIENNVGNAIEKLNDITKQVGAMSEKLDRLNNRSPRTSDQQLLDGAFVLNSPMDNSPTNSQRR